MLIVVAGVRAVAFHFLPSGVGMRMIAWWLPMPMHYSLCTRLVLNTRHPMTLLHTPPSLVVANQRQVDFMSKLWTCPFCMQRNHFPPHYAENISESNLPYELIPQFTTVEYELTTPPHGPPAFVFCIDTCVSEDELDELKDSLQQARGWCCWCCWCCR